MPCIGWLNGSVTGLGYPGSKGVDLICNKVTYISSLVLIHLFIVCFMNFIHTSTCLLLWRWYDDDITYSMFIFWWKYLNLSEIKLSPASDIIFFGNPNSKKITLHASIKLSVDMSSAFFTIGNLL